MFPEAQTELDRAVLGSCALTVVVLDGLLLARRSQVSPRQQGCCSLGSWLVPARALCSAGTQRAAQGWAGWLPVNQPTLTLVSVMVGCQHFYWGLWQSLHASPDPLGLCVWNSWGCGAGVCLSSSSYAGGALFGPCFPWVTAMSACELKIGLGISAPWRPLPGPQADLECFCKYLGTWSLQPFFLLPCLLE